MQYRLVASLRATACTLMKNHPTFLGCKLHGNGNHQSSACFHAITGNDVDMFTTQTKRAMIAIAPRCERCNALSALFADKCIVAAPQKVLPHTLFGNRVRFVLVRRLARKGLRIHRPSAITFDSFFIRSCGIRTEIPSNGTIVQVVSAWPSIGGSRAHCHWRPPLRVRGFERTRETSIHR